MELWIAIILDITAATIVFVPLIQGLVRGFKRQLLALISLVVSAVAAYACSTFLAAPIYDSYVKAPVTDACVSAIQQIDPVSYADKLLAEQGVSIPEDELREKLAESGDALGQIKEIAKDNGIDANKADEMSDKLKDDYLADAPEEVRSVVPKSLQKLESIEINESQLTDLLNAAVTSPQEGGEFVEEHFIRPTVRSLMKTALFVAAFVVMQLIMLLIFFIMGFELRAQAYGAGDRFGGFMLGLLAGAGNLVILCLLVSFIEKASLGLFSIETLPSKVFLPVFKLIF